MKTSQLLYAFNKLHRILKMNKTYRFSKLAKYMEIGTFITVVLNIIGLDTVADTLKLNKLSKRDTIFRMMLFKNQNLPILNKNIRKLINNKSLLRLILFSWLRYDKVAHKMVEKYELTIEDLYDYKYIIKKNIMFLQYDLQQLLNKKFFIKVIDLRILISCYVYMTITDIYYEKKETLL